MEPEHAGRRRLRRVDLSEVGAEDDDDVRDVAVMIRAEGLVAPTTRSTIFSPVAGSSSACSSRRRSAASDSTSSGSIRP
jgi:hypothetical protein